MGKTDRAKNMYFNKTAIHRPVKAQYDDGDTVLMRGMQRVGNIVPDSLSHYSTLSIIMHADTPSLVSVFQRLIIKADYT
jgi:hypothetical protein